MTTKPPQTVAEAQAAVDAAEESHRAALATLNTARFHLREAKRLAAEEADREARRRVDRARATAKRKAERLGVTIERETFGDGGPPIYWVHAPEGRYPDEEADPLNGCHTAAGWFEVLENVETYERAFADEDARTQGEG